MPSTDAAPLPLRCSMPDFAPKIHLMVSISAVSRGGSAVSRRKCRGRGVEDRGGMHSGVENGSGKHRGVDSSRSR